MIVIVQMVVITKQIITDTLDVHAMTTLRIIFLYPCWREKISLKISMKFAEHKPSVLVMDAVGAGHGDQTYSLQDVFCPDRPLHLFLSFPCHLCPLGLYSNAAV